jgi:integrase
LRERAETLAPSSVSRRLAAVVDAHRRAGFASPRDAAVVRDALASIEWHYRARRRATAPLDVESLSRMSLCLPPTTAGARDRAVLLLGYGAALRRTELVALDAHDVRVDGESAGGSLRLSLRRGAVVVPPGSQPHLCAVRAWQRWQSRAGIIDGPAFRPVDRHGNVRAVRLSDRAISAIVHRAAAGAGLDPDRYSGRSLRLGMVLTAHARGASDDQVMAQTGHRTRRLVRQYRTRTGTTPYSR